MLFSSGKESERLVSAGVMTSVESSVRSLRVAVSDMCTDSEISEEIKTQNWSTIILLEFGYLPIMQDGRLLLQVPECSHTRLFAPLSL